MRRHNPINEEELFDIDILDLEVAEYEDVARLKRARELAAQTEPKLTPTAIRKQLRTEGLGVGLEKYKEWEQEGLLKDIQAQAKEIARHLYEKECLSLQEVGKRLRAQGYPYHNQLIGVWKSEGGWVCDITTPAKDVTTTPMLDVSAFVELVSRVSGKEVNLKNWIGISREPLVMDNRDLTPWNILFNFFGKEFFNEMLSQSSYLYRGIDLLSRIAGVPHTSKRFLEAIKQPLIDQTDYTPLFLASNFAGVPQKQLFDTSARLLALEEDVPEEEEEEPATDAAWEAEAGLAEMMRVVKSQAEDIRQMQQIREKSLATHVISALKRYKYISFSQYVRTRMVYPSKRDMDYFIEIWNMIPTIDSDLAVKIYDYLLYTWIDMEPYEVEHFMMKERAIPPYLSVAIYAHMKQKGQDHTTLTELLDSFSGGAYKREHVYTILLQRCVNFGQVQGLFHLDGDDIYTEKVSRGDIEPLLPSVIPAYEMLELPGRNETCPCGSGRKYKKCCLKYIEGVGIWYDG